MYTPLTESGHSYRRMGYWFATGIWFEHARADPDSWIADRSSVFGDYCARRRDDYVFGNVTYLPSIPDLWDEFSDEIVFAPPTEATRADADTCQRHGLDPTGRFHP
jgi:hypothetical protein